jgi:outer membrane usher protein
MRPDDRPAAPPPTGLKLARIGIVGALLIVALMTALAIDRMPGLRGKQPQGLAVTGHAAATTGHTAAEKTLPPGRAVKPHVRPKRSDLIAQLPRSALTWLPTRSAAPSAAPTPANHNHEGALRPSARASVAEVTPAAAATPAAAIAASRQRAFLTFSVNGMDEGEVLAIIDHDDILIPLIELEHAGIQGIKGSTQTIDSQAYVSLRSLAPGISYAFDEQNLSLKVVAQTQYFGSTVVDMGGYAPPHIVYGTTASAFFNYALDWENFNQLSEFSEVGVSSHDNLYYTGFSIEPDGKFVRGLTNATFDNPALLKRWVVGDTFADNGVLGGATFLGGISVSRNFSLNPYYVRYPGVGLAGQVLTPSTADVYVNGHLVGTRSLAPGKFDITDIPVVAGGGTTQVVIRDAFGRTQTLSSSYYYATTVLQRGLSEYSYNLGSQRSNVGSASADYGPIVFAGFDRVGITDWFTAGARVDGGPGLISGGPTLAVRLGSGQLGLNGALSHDAGVGGGAAEADYTYQNRYLSFGGSLATMSSHYANLTLTTAVDRATSLATAFAGFEIGPRASITFNYTTGQWRDSGPRQNASVAGSVRLSERFDLVADAEHFHAGSSSNLYNLSLNYQIGRNTLGAVSQQGGSNGSGSAVSLQQSLPLGAGVGYRFEHGNGSQIQNDDLVQVQTAYGLYQAAYLQVNGLAQKDVLVSGALVDAGDGIMFSRAVQDGYAIIDLPGLQGVRGYFNNQEIGKTDGKGRLLIPDLLAYYGNRVEISDQDIPLDYSVDATEQTVATPYRGGTLVRFPVKREAAVTGTMIVDAAHKPLVPSFGQLRLAVGARDVVSELNREGEFYLEDMSPGRYAGEVEYAQGVCAFELVVPGGHEAITRVGSVRCTPPQVSGTAQ